MKDYNFRKVPPIREKKKIEKPVVDYQKIEAAELDLEDPVQRIEWIRRSRPQILNAKRKAKIFSSSENSIDLI